MRTNVPLEALLICDRGAEWSGQPPPVPTDQSLEEAWLRDDIWEVAKYVKRTAMCSHTVGAPQSEKGMRRSSTRWPGTGRRRS